MRLPKPGLGVYITAQWPNSETFRSLLSSLDQVADFVEIGVPTTNPKYDGPFIRLSHREAAVKGLGALQGLDLPKNAVLMAYAEDYLGKFDALARAAAESGAVSVLLPDLLVDFPEALEEYVLAVRRNGLDPSFFLPSKFPYALAGRLASYNPLFLYIGLYAATGIRLPVYVERNIKIARQYAGDVYIVAGFAIDSADRARAIVGAGADGLVVGTAAMKILKERGLQQTLAFLAEIKEALRSLNI
ncbi:tryptophan synthase subunit alpha [Thermoproteus tenax]|uniref:tryptophan synthase n=1 Tax=Thermoproteus tenax (strain ATCC 35583 / DSM 2078 / JCM 9277 / NBRC 100435 / Kra 1) TaxID=768679 RepID=G4RKD9_THETK|nr:Tryptophan synthase alpha chain [Thermoproteus tenax Kra 1]